MPTVCLFKFVKYFLRAMYYMFVRFGILLRAIYCTFVQFGKLLACNILHVHSVWKTFSNILYFHSVPNILRVCLVRNTSCVQCTVHSFSTKYFLRVIYCTFVQFGILLACNILYVRLVLERTFGILFRGLYCEFIWFGILLMDSFSFNICITRSFRYVQYVERSFGSEYFLQYVACLFSSEYFLHAIY